ncbi:hypothetical protein Taro_008589, partial [Colocasia esculenta]|nr:hypothetical protein [Colocasia esculenta]
MIQAFSPCSPRPKPFLFDLQSSSHDLWVEPPSRPQFGIGTSSRSAQGRIQRFHVRHSNSSLGEWSWAADAIAYGHPFAQTSITFRSIVRIAYKTPIRNRHSEAHVDPILPQPTNSPFPWFSGSNVSLDYANPWRGNHTESDWHGDRKLCSTRRKISSP